MATDDSWKPPRDGVENKVVRDVEAAAARREELRKQHKKVVLTNGAFDLLHVGHVRSLRHARSLGDHLMVAVNSDRAVRRSKGPDRPLFAEAERLELLAALGCVDTVFLFDEPTADAILLRLKPDVHAKGPDYTLETVPERATVLGYGGEIAITGDPKNHSSSSIQQKLRGGA
jgi:rfaE bifunctional protein nucleotidyltransferase chain/domain